MPLEVEDGSGKENAVTFCTVEFVTAYWALRGGSPGGVWESAPDLASDFDLQEAGCVLASDYVSTEWMRQYRGVRNATARLAWPRTGATRRNGTAIADNAVPWEVPEAVAILAPRAITAILNRTTLLPPVERGNAIKSESGLGFSTTYRDDAPSYTVHQDVEHLLRNLVRDALDTSTMQVLRVDPASEPYDDPAMRNSTFANPGVGTLGSR